MPPLSDKNVEKGGGFAPQAPLPLNVNKIIVQFTQSRVPRVRHRSWFIVVRSVDVAPDGGQVEHGQRTGQAHDQVRRLGGRVPGAAAAQRARLAPQVLRVDVGHGHAGPPVFGVRARGPPGRPVGQLRLGHAQRVHLHRLPEPPTQPLAQPQQPAVAL